MAINSVKFFVYVFSDFEWDIYPKRYFLMWYFLMGYLSKEVFFDVFVVCCFVFYKAELKISSKKRRKFLAPREIILNL